VVTHDVAIVGGGPAGSTCARFLTRGGARVAVIDRAEFPRVKLCAGWLSTPIWDVLEVAPRDFAAASGGGRLWEWSTCHVHFRGQSHAIGVRGFFIRRYELDHYLLSTSGADLRLGQQVKGIERGADGVWTIGDVRARHLVGAGGTHCPVARILGPTRPRGPVGAQEHEFQSDAGAVARTRVGADGEPELLLHDDLRGYAWNIPKTDWLNVGCGTLNAQEVRAAWQRARDHFRSAGHVPTEARDALDHVKGHSYYLYDPVHLERAARVDADGKGGVYLVGDSLGLAQPLTAEGILPATLSGRVLAESILAGDPASYPQRLRSHPIIADYERVFRLREAGASLRDMARARATPEPPRRRRITLPPLPDAARAALGRTGGKAVAAGFAWMFSGARLPAPQLVDLVLAGADRWLARGATPSPSDS
jgi:flavin-dependent dehydrogenase